jgi:hypothetical protein
MSKKILAAAKKARSKYKKKKVVKKVTPLERRARLAKAKKFAKAKKSRKAGLGIKKPKARKADTLSPMIIPIPKPKRKIPKDVTKRAPKTVPMRKSAMPRSAKSPSVPSRFRRAFPMGLSGGLGIGLGIKAAKGVRKARLKKR